MYFGNKIKEAVRKSMSTVQINPMVCIVISDFDYFPIPRHEGTAMIEGEMN